MQSTAEFHHHIPDPLLPQTDPVFHDATALDTAVDMLNPQPTAVQRLVGHLLFQRELLAAWFLGGHEDLHLRARERQEAQILSQPAPCGQGIRGRVGNALIMDAASKRLTEKKDREQGVDQQDIFDGVVLFLAALTCGLLRRVLGADDTPFGAVMGTRGDADAAAGPVTTGAGTSSSGTTTVAASASETPSRWARAGRERAGASPRVRSAGKSTWIH